MLHALSNEQYYANVLFLLYVFVNYTKSDMQLQGNQRQEVSSH